MAVPLSVPNTSSLEESQIVPQVETVYLVKETKSSRELFEEFRDAYPEILRQWGINEDNYIRTPNGTGEYEGLWVAPFPQDVWDFWINFRFSAGETRSLYKRTHPEYIPLITDISAYTNPPVPGGFVYNPLLIYLWDFLHNPETLTGRTFRGAPKQPKRREFPVYTEDLVSSDDSLILPLFLPDATFPRSFAQDYPWAAWETVIDLSDAQIQGEFKLPMHAIRAQRQNYIRAHGASALINERNSDAYRFSPHESTATLGRVVRPLYPLQEAALYKGYYAIPYSPLVLRNMSAYNSNGWILCFRQALRYSNSAYFPKNKLWKYFRDAARMLYNDPEMTVDYAVMRVMQREARKLWPNEPFALFESNFVLGEIPVENLGLKEAEDFENVRTALKQAKDVQDIYELATSLSGPVYENAPFLVITVQVHEINPRRRRVVSFDDLGRFILSVPPILSVDKPLEIDYYKTDQALNWRVQRGDLNSKFMFDSEDVVSAHQIQVAFSRYGEMLVTCKAMYTMYRSTEVIVSTYRFKLTWLKFVSKIIGLDHQRINTTFPVYAELASDFQNYSFLQTSDSILFSYAENDVYTIAHLVNTWPLYELNSATWENRTLPDMKFTVDFSRPILLVRDLDTKSTLYLFVVKLAPVKIEISRFGEYVKLNLAYDSATKYVTWKSPQGKDMFLAERSQFAFHVVIPRHLGVYTAEIRNRGSVGVPEYSVTFLIELKWDIKVPYGYIQRSSLLEFEKNGTWAYSNPAVTHDRVILPNERRIELISDLRADYNSVFYRKMINAWAYNYMVDLENYAQCFPYVLQYCRLMDMLLQKFISQSDRNVILIDRMDPNIRQFLPNYMSEPILNLQLLPTDEDSADSHYSYVIFDPLYGKWINIMSLYQHERTINPKWLPKDMEQFDELHRSIKRLYVHVSPESQFIGEEQQREAAAEPTGKWVTIRDNYDSVRETIESLRREYADVLNQLTGAYNDARDVIKTQQQLFLEEKEQEIHQKITLRVTSQISQRYRELEIYIRYVSSVLTLSVYLNIYLTIQRNYDLEPFWIKLQPGLILIYRWYVSDLFNFRTIWTQIIKENSLAGRPRHVYFVATIKKGTAPAFIEELIRENMPYNEKKVLLLFVKYYISNSKVEIDTELLLERIQSELDSIV